MVVMMVRAAVPCVLPMVLVRMMVVRWGLLRVLEAVMCVVRLGIHCVRGHWTRYSVYHFADCAM